MMGLFLLIIACALAQPPPDVRAKATLAKMTLDQKISYVHGHSGPYVGQIPAIPELGLPAITMEDGPQGVADGTTGVTCWPSAHTVTQSWDPQLFFEYSAAMGREQRAKGSTVMLGPMMNLGRVPEGARNFESVGEDPFLASRMVEQSVEGIQSNGIMACAKHWLNNDDDPPAPVSRFNYSVEIDEDTQYMYIQPFVAAIRAGALSVMCSYNRVNSVFACENNYTLGLLKHGFLKFPYFVVSDWGATHSTVPAALAGLDIEMPSDVYFGAALRAAVMSGEVPLTTLDDKVYRVLLAAYTSGIVDNPPTGNLSSPVTTPASQALAKKLATQSAVLLQNENKVLPLPMSDEPLRIAVCGKGGSDAGDMVAGGGSGHVVPPYVVAAREGLSNFASERNLTNVDVTYTGDDPIVARVECEKADVCVIIIQVYTHEGNDRKNLSIGVLQELYLDAVLPVAKKSIVVIHIASAVLVEPFANRTDAIVTMGYPGQEDGNALASLLFGEVAFSGRLALTWPRSQAQLDFSPAQWPGVPAKDPCINECKRDSSPYHTMTYSEKNLIGYRWYTAMNLSPQYAFGFGLTYTTFAYSNFQVTPKSDGTLTFSCFLDNTGSAVAPDVVQLYVGYPSEYTKQPPMQLKGFAKTQPLDVGETISVNIDVDPARDLLVWSSGDKRPVQAYGLFTAYFAASSTDIRGKIAFQVQQ